MKYLNNLPVTGHEHIDVGCHRSGQVTSLPLYSQQTENAFPQNPHLPLNR